jgi:hypothetical protein
MKNAGYLTAEDEKAVFTRSELVGYGVYGDTVHTDGKDYYVHFFLGSTCD